MEFLLGTEGAQAISARLLNYGAPIIRGFGVFVLTVGSFVIYAVMWIGLASFPLDLVTGFAVVWKETQGSAITVA